MSNKKLEKKENQVTIGIFGDGGCGKSCLTIRYVNSQYSDDYNATIYDNFHQIVKIDEQEIELTICDTAGQDEFRSLIGEWIHISDGVVLCYDVTNRKSMGELINYLDTLKRRKDDVLGQGNPDLPMYPLIICGTKCDLEDDREIKAKEMKEFAEKNVFEKGANYSKYSSTIPYWIETSAKKNINVSEAFSSVIRQVMERRKWIKEKSTVQTTEKKQGFFSSISETSGSDDIKDFQDKMKK